MARGRMINQTIDYDAEFNALSIDAQLMYLRTLAFLDRDGLIFGHPRALLAKVAPLLDFTQGQIQDIIDQWVDMGLVIRYRAKIGDVLFFKGFAKNQSGMHYDRESPSRFDPPPGWAHGPKGIVLIVAGQSPTTPQDNSESDAGEIPTTPLEGVPIDSGKSPAEVRQESGGSPTQIEVEVKDQLEDQPKQGDEDEDTRARDAIHDAWFEIYQDELPENLEEPIAKLLKETSEAAVIHGIRASVNSDSRSFKFIGKCARNYIPPAPIIPTSNGYHVDLPGVFALEPSAQSSPPPPPLPVMAHDDPWAVCLSELQGSLPGVALGYLEGSRIEEAGDVEGVPLYRVVCEERAASGLSWLTAQAGPAIRRKLGSVLRKSVVVEIVAAEPVAVPA